MQHDLTSRLKIVARRNGSLLAKLGATLSLGLAANLLTPWPMKILFDQVLARGAGGKTALIVALAAATFLLIVCRGFFNHLRHVQLVRFGDLVGDDLRAAATENILGARAGATVPFASDDLRARIIEDADRVRACVIEGLAAVGAEGITMIGTFGVLFWVDVPFAFLCAGFVFLLFILYRTAPASINAMNHRARASEAERTNFAGELLRHRFFVKAWAREAPEKRRLERMNDECSGAIAERTRGEARFVLLVEVLTALMFATILGYGGLGVAAGRISMGDLVLFVQYLGFLYAPIGRASGFFQVYQQARTSWERIREALSLPQEKNGPSPGLPTSPPLVRIERLGFGYPDRAPLFRGFDLTVPAGSVVALIGASGAGKSTLLRLIEAFEDPAQGRISFDGRPIAEIPAAELRSRIAFVEQEPVLFSGTLRENLLYGCDADPGEYFHEICEALEIDSFVRQFPERFETRVAEGGVGLSIGQRQRVSLARALLSRRPLLLLDEPTSALDPKMEERLVERLARVIHGRTVIFATHRTRPLQLANMVVDLDRLAHAKAFAPEKVLV